MNDGLPQAEAARRLAAEGPNELPAPSRRGPLQVALDVVREPMFLLLIASGTLYLLLGDIQEALLLLAFVFVVAGITIAQERKTERALDALKELSSPRAIVVRDGQKLRIPGREVVRGDVFLISEGDRIAADAVVLECTNLSVDESLLTGESVPVLKCPADGPIDMARPGGDSTPLLFSGTLAVQGRAVAEVRATGIRTEIGRIGKALSSVSSEITPLQREIRRLVKLFATIGLALCLIVTVLVGLQQGDWIRGLLAGITLGMAILPEEFPVVLTIFLALGAWRLARHAVLTRRIPAVETLGATTALCVDKTGTLTLNRMSVAELGAGNDTCIVDSLGTALPEAFHPVVEYAVLASPSDPFDPMERAMRELGERTLCGTEHLHRDWTLLREYSLSPKLFAMSRVWQSPDRRDWVIAAKGAPEAIAELCHLSADDAGSLAERIATMAANGRRVLGVARCVMHEGQPLPEAQHDFPFEFIGLLGLADPVRPGVPEALAECQKAGIHVLMLTGDHPGTAQAIARSIGIANPNDVITGDQLDALSDEALAARVGCVNLFARMIPEQKLRLVRALAANGEIVAMTGDGVNDAPALKAAHIGIAMGGRGTDVAREAGAIVLLDDAFGSIVKGIRTGRRIFDNLKRAMLYIFVVHIPIAGLSLVPVLLGWPLVLLPIHVVFLELIIDPACTAVFEAEPEEQGVMERPPRAIGEPLFGSRELSIGMLQGGAELAVELALLWWARSHVGERGARAAVFTTMVLCNLGLIFVSRAGTRSLIATLRAPNRPEIAVTLGALGFLTLALAVPPARSLFSFDILPKEVLLAACLAALASVTVAAFVRRWIPPSHKVHPKPSPQTLRT